MESSMCCVSKVLYFDLVAVVVILNVIVVVVDYGSKSNDNYVGSIST